MRITTALLGGAVMAVVVAVALLLPWSGPRAFPLFDRVALCLLGAAIAGFLWGVLARPLLVADEEGLLVRNLVRSRRLAWTEVVRVVFRVGDPWVYLDLSDGDRIAVMAVQGSDGARARRAVAELRALVTRYGEATEDRS